MRDLVTEICYLAAEKFFDFEKQPLQYFKSEEENKKSNRCLDFLEQNAHLKDDIFLSKLAKNFSRRLVILNDDGKFEYGQNGRDFFILFRNDKIFYHSNAGRVTKLPAGVGKLNKPIHRLDAIIFSLNGRKLKCETCPLLGKCKFDDLEKLYKIRLEVWSKSKINSKFSIVKLRTSKNLKWPLARLHLDSKTERLFLIQNTSLYFRGSLKRLKKDFLI